MRIGITADINLTLTNSINLKLANFAPKPLLDVLIKNKVIPIIFPIASPKMAKELLETVDGIIIPGGPDVAPFLYQAEPILQNGATYQLRDEFELELIKQIQLAHKPLLGICRGIQIVNLALGGSVYQDLTTQFPSPNLLQHHQKTLGNLPVHTVKISQGSQLFQIFGHSAYVNSRHHQAVKEPAPGLKISAQSSDGVIEGLEDQAGLVQLVQWHPENLWQNDPLEEKLFQQFFKRVEKVKQAHC